MRSSAAGASTLDDAPALERTAMAIKERCACFRGLRSRPPRRGRQRDRRLLDPRQPFVVVGHYRRPRSAVLRPSGGFRPSALHPVARARTARARLLPVRRRPARLIGSLFAMLQATIALALLLRRIRVHRHQAAVGWPTSGSAAAQGAVLVQLMAR